ncbi:MAG: amidohydrolase [Clostridiaceae bacterium]|nr:amidohydrolase [Clostridiaceae bacterium]
MDKKKSTYKAMAVEASGKIFALGTSEEILALRDNETYIYDLENHAVIPGLVDTHTHIFQAGLSELHEEQFIPVSIKELLECIKKKVQVVKAGEWIHLRNTYPTRLEEYRFPTLEELDAVAPSNPVYVDAAYAGQANSCALRLLNIDENTPGPGNGKFIRDKSTGKLTGLLFCCGDIVRKALTTKNDTVEDLVKDIKTGFLNIQANYHKYGITSVVDAMTGEADIMALNELYKEGKLGLRTILTGMVSSPSLPAAEENLERLKGLVALPCEWGRLSFCKVMLDGGILTGTAYMRRPYNDTIGIFGINFDNFKGIINYNSSRLKDIIAVAVKTNLQMTAHCIGDAAADILLDAYESYHKENSIKDRRFSIIHCDFTDEDTLERIKNLNLSILFQPAWHYMDGDILAKVLDKETMESFLPYKKYIDMGIHASAGSDHMIKYDPVLSHNPYNPFLSLYNMVTRKTRLGNIIDGANCISRHDALAMYTSKASYISFDENNKGTLETGKYADFTVLSKDYFTCPEEDIKGIHSIMTVVGGDIVYPAMKPE